MHNKNRLLELLLTLLKCFLILIFLGILLPEIIDYILHIFIQSNVYENSKLVNQVVENNENILYNYMYIIKLLLFY